MAPILADMTQVPRPVLRSWLGKSSPTYTYSAPNEPATQSLPIIATVTAPAVLTARQQQTDILYMHFVAFLNLYHLTMCCIALTKASGTD